tara:strand:- start:4442 stop:5188 length:747 start_codon:yes stop_codon:yes gene_type:complete
MSFYNKSRLRNTLKKLNRLPVPGGNEQARAQDALDFLSMMAGKKPVMLLGRGYDETSWIKGVLTIANELRLYIIEGPFWNASDHSATGTKLPNWYIDHTRRTFAEHKAWYLCRSRKTADEVTNICDLATITIAQEAHLLNYPECCVMAHYDRALTYQEIWLEILRKKAGNDDTKAQNILTQENALEPDNQMDIKRLETAMVVNPVPYTSINACLACINGGPQTPANLLSSAGRTLAAEVDPGFLRALS